MKEYRFSNGASVMAYTLSRGGYCRKCFAVFFSGELIIDELTSWSKAKALALSL